MSKVFILLAFSIFAQVVIVKSQGKMELLPGFNLTAGTNKLYVGIMLKTSKQKNCYGYMYLQQTGDFKMEPNSPTLKFKLPETQEERFTINIKDKTGKYLEKKPLALLHDKAFAKRENKTSLQKFAKTFYDPTFLGNFTIDNMFVIKEEQEYELEIKSRIFCFDGRNPPSMLILPLLKTNVWLKPN